MKYFLILSVILASATARKYSSKHDKLDIDAMVQTPQYLETSVGCYLDRNHCDRTTATLKRAIPEIIQQACEKCTSTQKYILKRYLEELKKNLPQDYAAFRHKYDPENRYFDILEESLFEI